MAVEVRTEQIPAIAEIKPVNTFVLDTIFGETRYFATQKVRFDFAVTSNQTAEFKSFLEKANVITKDGYNVVELTPLSINQSIVKTAEDAKLRGFGEPVIGAEPASEAEQQLQDELEGFAKLRAMAKRKEVQVAYEAMVRGKIAYGIDGIDEIDFGMPNDHKEVLATPWTDNSADPIADMIAVYDKMDTQPDIVILSKTAYNAFISNPNVLTDRADGKAKNFQKAEAGESGRYGKGVVYVGTLVDRPLEVVVDMQVFKDEDGNNVEALANDYAVYASRGAGARLYGGVPMTQGNKVGLVAVEFLPLVETQENPAQVELIYRSSPLPTLRNPNAFYSQKVA